MKKTLMKETPADVAVKAKALENSGKRLREHIDALNNLADQKATIGEAIKDRFALVKGEGYDTKAVRVLIKRLDEDEDKRDARLELEAVIDVYQAAVAADEG